MVAARLRTFGGFGLVDVACEHHQVSIRLHYISLQRYTNVSVWSVFPAKGDTFGFFRTARLGDLVGQESSTRCQDISKMRMSAPSDRR